MVGVYPGIAALCMIAREKIISTLLKNILFLIAALQTMAFGCDVWENMYLYKWIKDPVIGDSEFSMYHFVVITKWMIAVTGALLAIPLSLRPIKKF